MKLPHKKLLWLLLSGLSVSCSAIYEDLDPCESRISFVYDYNMAFANTPPGTPVGIDLFIFDRDSQFVALRRDYPQDFAETGVHEYSLSMPTGDYHLIAWAGHEEPFYECPELEPGVSTMKDLHVRLRRDEDNHLRMDEPLDPLLYGNAVFSIDSARHSYATIHMLNNTKSITFLLQSTTTDSLPEEQYSFRITADNGHMDYRNELIEDSGVVYHEHFKAGIDQEEDIDVLKAEINTLRLMADEPSRLQILSNPENGSRPDAKPASEEPECLLDIDLTAYLLMFKSVYYRNIPDQEWLDRSNTFNIVFFINPATGIVSALQIENWRVVLNDMGI